MSWYFMGQVPDPEMDVLEARGVIKIYDTPDPYRNYPNIERRDKRKIEQLTRAEVLTIWSRAFNNEDVSHCSNELLQCKFLDALDSGAINRTLLYD